MTRTRTTLLTSAVAVALIAGVGLAFAQTPAPDAVPSTPAEKTAPLQAPKGAAATKAPDAAMKPGRADAKVDRKGDKARSAQGAAKDSTMPRGGMTSKGTNSGANIGPKSQDKARAGVNAEPRTATDTRDPPQTLDNRTGDARSGARDRDSAGRSENLSGEQRSTIRTVITRQNVRPMTNATFAITVGTRVPRTAHFNRVPVELVAINPRWRGFDYVLVGDQILVVNPRTHKIVAILDA
jgi:hypothetical protein